MNEKKEFGSLILLEEMKTLLLSELSILRQVTDSKKLENRSEYLLVPIASLISTSNSILLLMHEHMRFYNEGVMLARGFFERITNICYLLLCDEETFLKCFQHIVFRQYKRGKKNEKVIKDNSENILAKMSIKMEDIDKIKDDKSIDEAIKLFEGNNSSKFPIPKIEKRLGFIANNTKSINIGLFLAYQETYYDDASEAIHGSLYGFFFHLININSRDKKEVEIELNKNATLLIFQTAELLHQLISLLKEQNELNVFYEQSKKISKTMFDFLKESL